MPADQRLQVAPASTASMQRVPLVLELVLQNAGGAMPSGAVPGPQGAGPRDDATPAQGPTRRRRSLPPPARG